MTPEQKLLGSTTRLSMIKTSKFGIYLGSDEYPGLEVLLPNNQVPQGIAPGDPLEARWLGWFDRFRRETWGRG